MWLSQKEELEPAPMTSCRFLHNIRAGYSAVWEIQQHLHGQGGAPHCSCGYLEESVNSVVQGMSFSCARWTPPSADTLSHHSVKEYLSSFRWGKLQNFGVCERFSSRFQHYLSDCLVTKRKFQFEREPVMPSFECNGTSQNYLFYAIPTIFQKWRNKIFCLGILCY